MPEQHDDTWLSSAIHNTDLVAQLLFTLRHHHSPPSSSSPPPTPKTWTVRQPRSTSKSSGKKPPADVASPTTPLSWSGGGSVDESSRVLHDGSDISRSKVIGSNETTPTKRSRKKKTLAELRDDEIKLLREQKQLKRQLASLQATCQKKRKENESLKKMKDDMKSPVLAGSEVNKYTEGWKNNGFVLPDLNIPAGEDC